MWRSIGIESFFLRNQLCSAIETFEALSYNFSTEFMEERLNSGVAEELPLPCFGVKSPQVPASYALCRIKDLVLSKTMDF